ncbi:DNA gyrase inhibitor YacG [Snodgrassella sp. CFCC 13594]|uniref:DNA gyrase inhibitor YacG n=1 Tax=Snodgrassella sp. CFCC 13594 TaxID=1775559 RepID=UPI000A905432
MSTMHHPTMVACPTCGKPVAWLPENRFRPFCSERCKLIDLGAWASEDYNLPAVDDGPHEDDIHPRHH